MYSPMWLWWLCFPVYRTAGMPAMYNQRGICYSCMRWELGFCSTHRQALQSPGRKSNWNRLSFYPGRRWILQYFPVLSQLPNIAWFKNYSSLNRSCFRKKRSAVAAIFSWPHIYQRLYDLCTIAYNIRYTLLYNILK